MTDSAGKNSSEAWEKQLARLAGMDQAEANAKMLANLVISFRTTLFDEGLSREEVSTYVVAYIHGLFTMLKSKE